MKSQWYDTKKELPKINQVVAVKLNKNWFNDYLLLEETDIVNNSRLASKTDFCKSKYLVTKDLAAISGISSREINASLVTLKLMVKKENDWIATQKGEGYGAIQKEGQYGKFIEWPEEILNELELM